MIVQEIQTPEKNILLLQQFGINYERQPVMFHSGSCVYRDKVRESIHDTEGRDLVQHSLKGSLVFGHQLLLPHEKVC
ncbi:tRNA(His) guanylyltransferase 1-like [Macadamia integrifolia]|uniref:tRNA(His) guanylyltransferase 1-like n=1 Tax=Macadamia integrifolia TaxID=60698 RepID=UPI001C52B0E2|nr:tRNA(His) guanylyltransferase 1-like [Macadamia integrifolia]